MLRRKWRILILSCLLLLNCGTEVGNPDDEDENKTIDRTQNPNETTAASPSLPEKPYDVPISADDVIYKRIVRVGNCVFKFLKEPELAGKLQIDFITNVHNMSVYLLDSLGVLKEYTESMEFDIGNYRLGIKSEDETSLCEIQILFNEQDKNEGVKIEISNL